MFIDLNCTIYIVYTIQHIILFANLINNFHGYTVKEKMTKYNK